MNTLKNVDFFRRYKQIYALMSDISSKLYFISTALLVCDQRKTQVLRSFPHPGIGFLQEKKILRTP